MLNGYLQLGYVTTDFNQAKARACESFGAIEFTDALNWTIGARGKQTVTTHIALGFRHNTQIEIIQPLQGDIAFYRECMPNPDEFQLILRHVSQYFPDPEEYLRAKSSLSAKWPLVVDHHILDGEFCHLDSRSEIGHYTEIFCFPPETHFK